MADTSFTTGVNSSNNDLRQLIHSYVHEKDISSNPIALNEIDCNYYDVCDIPPDNTGKLFKTIHWNIQGLASKFDDLKMLLSQAHDNNSSFDCILLCETFICDQNAKLFNLPGYNLFHKSRQIKSKGGVAIYLRDDLKYKLRDDLSIFIEGEFESLFIEICGQSSPILVGEIYRTPHSNIQSSLERYSMVLQKLNNLNHTIIIGTDQNIDYLKINTHKAASDLLDIYFDANLIPTITKPTRVSIQTKSDGSSAKSATLIDNLYIKHKGVHAKSGIICCDISDHFPIFCYIPYTKQNKSQEPLSFRYRPLTDTTVQIIASELKATDWSYINSQPIDVSCDRLIKRINC